MNCKREYYDTVVIGGGFFGLYIAEFLALKGEKVLLCEKYNKCMTRASYANQARVHNGYHYPRSLLTAMRSRISFPRFVAEFPECIESNFDKYYAIGKILGKVTAKQFFEFCNRIGAPCELAAPKIKQLFNKQLIEEVFLAQEYAFDAVKLHDAILSRVLNAQVEICTEHSVEKVKQTKNNKLELTVRDICNDFTILADNVFNCSYSQINYLNVKSELELIPLKHEMTEMALVTPPEELRKLGITVMCGPFFSVMPFPHRNLHSFSHVRYTPHYEWYDNNNKNYHSSYQIASSDPKQSSFKHMRKDAVRYMPLLKDCVYEESIWEVKTVLPASEVDDSRPILFKTDYILNGYHCIMGGKVDNVYDVIDVIKNIKRGIWK